MSIDDDNELYKLELLIEQQEEVNEKITKTVSNLILARELTHKQLLAISTYQRSFIDFNQAIKELKILISTVGRNEKTRRC